MNYFYDDEHDSLFISLRDGEYDEAEPLGARASRPRL